jgi:hypothetical protein
LYFARTNSGRARERRLLVHEDESVYGRPIRSRMLIATVQRLDPENPEMSVNLISGSIDREKARITICYGIAGRSACVPSAPRRLPRISPRYCPLAGTSSILLSWSIPRLLVETKRLCGVM